MTQIFVPRNFDNLEKRSYLVGTAGGILMGKLVEINSSKKVILATNANKAIGIINSMPSYRAENSTYTVDADDLAEVVMFGTTFKGKTGGTFSAGSYLAVASGVISGTTAVTQIIALEASTAALQEVEYLVK